MHKTTFPVSKVLHNFTEAATQYVISICGYNDVGEGKAEYELIYTREINSMYLGGDHMLIRQY